MVIKTETENKIDNKTVRTGIICLSIIASIFIICMFVFVISLNPYTIKFEMDNNTAKAISSLKDIDIEKQDFTSYPVNRCELISDTQTIICNNFE